MVGDVRAHGADEDELIEDPECLGGLQLDRADPPLLDKRSIVYTYIVPEQETKLATGDGRARAPTPAKRIGEIDVRRGEASGCG